MNTFSFVTSSYLATTEHESNSYFLKLYSCHLAEQDQILKGQCNSWDHKINANFMHFVSAKDSFYTPYTNLKDVFVKAPNMIKLHAASIWQQYSCVYNMI